MSGGWNRGIRGDEPPRRRGALRGALVRRDGRLVDEQTADQHDGNDVHCERAEVEEAADRESDGLRTTRVDLG